MGVNVGLFQNPLSDNVELKESSVITEPNKDLKTTLQQRENDLRKIMEHSLSQIFKFPGSVKFQDTQFMYNRVFHDHGINITPEKELEFATLCGQYSAQNAMAVYGKKSPFYAEIAVNNEEKGVTGNVWIEIDGEVKTLFSLDSSFTNNGDINEFKKLYAKNCGSADSAFMGIFNQYDIGYKAIAVKNYIEFLNKLSKYPESKNSLKKCSNSGASYDYCIVSEICKRVKDPEKSIGELCILKNKTCTVDDVCSICEEKLKIVRKKENKASTK